MVMNTTLNEMRTGVPTLDIHANQGDFAPVASHSTLATIVSGVLFIAVFFGVGYFVFFTN
jgi:hypothetical protein